VDFHFQSLMPVDPQVHRVFPHVYQELGRHLDREQSGMEARAPWNILVTMTSPVFGPALRKFAQSQVWVDEAQIACGLERYHLAHNGYPSTLNALVPETIAELPHDIINGQPYRYHLNPDGTFLLYSVGWNQTDDGGKTAYKPDAPSLMDPEHGDWVWPVPKRNP